MGRRHWEFELSEEDALCLQCQVPGGCIEWHPDCLRRGVLARRELERALAEVDSVGGRLLRRLGEEPTSFNELVEANGGKRHSTQLVMSRLVHLGLVRRVKMGWYVLSNSLAKAGESVVR